MAPKESQAESVQRDFAALQISVSESDAAALAEKKSKQAQSLRRDFEQVSDLQSDAAALPEKASQVDSGYEAVVKDLVKKVEELTNSLAKLREERVNLADNLVKEREEQVTLADNLAKEREQRVNLADNLAKMREQRVNLADNLAKEREERVNLADNLAKMREQRVNLADNLAKMREQRVNLADNLAKMREERVNLADNLAKELKERADLAKKFDTLMLDEKKEFPRQTVRVDMGKTISIKCPLVAVEKCVWSYWPIKSQKKKLQNTRDFTLPLAKLGDSVQVCCDMTNLRGETVTAWFDIKVEAYGRVAPNIIAKKRDRYKEFMGRISNDCHSPLFFEQFRSFNAHTKKEWMPGQSASNESGDDDGFAEPALKLVDFARAHNLEVYPESQMMINVIPPLETALGYKFQTRGARGVPATALPSQRTSRSASVADPELNLEATSPESSLEATMKIQTRSQTRAASEKEKSLRTAKCAGKAKSVSYSAVLPSRKRTGARSASDADPQSQLNLETPPKMQTRARAAPDKQKSPRAEKSTTSADPDSESERVLETKTRTAKRKNKIVEKAKSVGAIPDSDPDWKPSKDRGSSATPSKGYHTDGAIVFSDAVLLNLEKKDGMRITGNPKFQCFRYIEDFREQLPPKWGKNGNLGRGGLFPSYAVTVEGSELCLYGVVTIVENQDRLVEKMSYYLLENLDLAGPVLPVQQFLRNLRRAVDKLREYYLLYEEPERPERLVPSFPAVDRFKGHELKFVDAFVKKHPLMFLAEWDSKHVVVKFIGKGGGYGSEVHRFCADEGIAPAYYGEEKVGPFKMVAMERCEEGFLPYYDAQEKEWFDRSKAFPAVERALQKLHKGKGEAKFVHGDFRDLNVLINCQFDVKIIDFDWSGRVSEVRYPPLLNHAEINYHDDAKSGTEIKQSHDTFFLDTLF